MSKKSQVNSGSASVAAGVTTTASPATPTAAVASGSGITGATANAGTAEDRESGAAVGAIEAAVEKDNTVLDGYVDAMNPAKVAIPKTIEKNQATIIRLISSVINESGSPEVFKARWGNLVKRFVHAASGENNTKSPFYLRYFSRWHNEEQPDKLIRFMRVTSLLCAAGSSGANKSTVSSSVDIQKCLEGSAGEKGLAMVMSYYGL